MPYEAHTWTCHKGSGSTGKRGVHSVLACSGSWAQQEGSGIIHTNIALSDSSSNISVLLLHCPTGEYVPSAFPAPAPAQRLAGHAAPMDHRSASQGHLRHGKRRSHRYCRYPALLPEADQPQHSDPQYQTSGLSQATGLPEQSLCLKEHPGSGCLTETSGK